MADPFIGAVAQGVRLDVFDQRGLEGFVDAFVDVDPFEVEADLPALVSEKASMTGDCYKPVPS